MYDRKFRQRPFVFLFVLLHRVCKHIRLGILETSLCVYVCVIVEGMCTCRTDHFGNETLGLYLFFCIGYTHMLDWAFCKCAFEFIFLLFRGFVHM